MIELIVHYIKPSGCCHGPNGVTTTPGPPDEPVTAWPKPGAWLDTPPFYEGCGACPPWLPSGAWVCTFPVWLSPVSFPASCTTWLSTPLPSAV